MARKKKLSELTLEEAPRHSVEQLVRLLEARIRRFKRRLKTERAKEMGLRYKSNHIRRNSPYRPRIGFFTDRMQEAQWLHAYLKGRVDRKTYLAFQVDDDFDKLMTFVGDMR